MKDVLELLASGSTEAEILADFPYLEPEDFPAVYRFAAEQSGYPILQIAK